jgi:hypothetical protein
VQTDRTEWMESRTSRIEALIREWLADPDVVLVCGRWSAGVIAEIFPAGTGVLTPQGYDGRFAGVRDLTIPGTRHHLHLDLGKFRGALFLVAPSVCFGFRPSFEVWFDTAERDAIDLAGRPSSDFGFAIAHPYADGRLDQPKVLRYLERFVDQQRRFPDVVDLEFRRRPREEASVWREIGDCVWRVTEGEPPGVDSPPDPELLCQRLKRASMRVSARG